MKILHILNSDFGARATMGVRSYYILSQTNDYEVFCRGNLSVIKKGIHSPFLGFRFLSRGIQFLRMLHHSFSILKKIEKKLFEVSCKKYIKNADIIHLFFHSKPLLDYAQKYNKKVVVEGFTNPLRIQEMYNNGIKLDNSKFSLNSDEIYCYQNCDLLISPSAWVTSTMSGLSIKGKIVEIPYGVDSYTTSARKLNGKIKFCFAGGIKRTKGVIDLLEAARELHEDYPEKFELHLYGRLYSELQMEIEQFNAPYIFFHGYEDDVYKIYQDKHVYVFPTYFEGSSKTVFEAMAFGLPIITTFNSGSQVIDGLNGFIIEMNCPSDIFLTMKKFMDIPDLISKMGEESLNIAKIKTWPDYAKNVNLCYENLK